MSELQPIQDAPAYPVNSGPSYSRLTTEDIGLILRWHSEGKTQAEIAQRLGKTQAAISLLLKRLGHDSSLAALALLKSRAYKSAKRVTRIAENSDNEAEALKAAKVVLAAAGVTTDAKGDNGQGVTIQIGIMGAPSVSAEGAKVSIVSEKLSPVAR